MPIPFLRPLCFLRTISFGEELRVEPQKSQKTQTGESGIGDAVDSLGPVRPDPKRDEVRRSRRRHRKRNTVNHQRHEQFDRVEWFGRDPVRGVLGTGNCPGQDPPKVSKLTTIANRHAPREGTRPTGGVRRPTRSRLRDEAEAAGLVHEPVGRQGRGVGIRIPCGIDEPDVAVPGLLDDGTGGARADIDQSARGVGGNLHV